MNKDKIIQDARTEIERYAKQEGIDVRKMCFYESLALCGAIREADPKQLPLFMCGTAYFRFVSEDKDDGKINTHYTYLVNELDLIESMWLKRLPECHCWAFIFDKGSDQEGHVIDSTTRHITSLASEIGEVSFYQPDYVWMHNNKEVLTDRCYLPSVEAMAVVLPFIRIFRRDHCLKDYPLMAAGIDHTLSMIRKF